MKIAESCFSIFDQTQKSDQLTVLSISNNLNGG